MCVCYGPSRKSVITYNDWALYTMSEFFNVYNNKVVIID